MTVSGKSHSAENLEESFTLAKRFKSHRKRTCHLKKSDITCWAWEKPNFETKIIPLEKSHNAENCKKGGPLGFLNIHSVAKFQKIEGRTLWEH